MRNAPQLVRWIHPNLDHTNQGPDNIPSYFGVVVNCAHSIGSSFLPLELRCHKIDSRLVMVKGTLRVVFTELSKVEIC